MFEKKHISCVAMVSEDLTWIKWNMKLFEKIDQSYGNTTVGFCNHDYALSHTPILIRNHFHKTVLIRVTPGYSI